jgi:hypothetical protein
MAQLAFNPVHYGFKWTEDGTEYGWYEFDHKAAHKLALQARNAVAKAAEREGKRVHKWTSGGALMTRGGIGSGHPQIEVVVSVYYLEVYDN